MHFQHSTFSACFLTSFGRFCLPLFGGVFFCVCFFFNFWIHDINVKIFILKKKKDNEDRIKYMIKEI